MKSVQLWLTQTNLKKLQKVCKTNSDNLSLEIIDESNSNLVEVKLHYISIDFLTIILLINIK